MGLVADLLREDKRVIRNASFAALSVLATNLSSLPVPYMQRALGTQAEIAAVTSYYSVGRTFTVETRFGQLEIPSPAYLLYGYGRNAGMKLAYNDADFQQTARKLLIE